jgi:signal transduction histidine kinase/DNA-binding response OmpR family regulator
VPHPHKILLLEDSPYHAQLIREMIAESGLATGEIAHFERLYDACQALSSERFDVILADLGLPDSFGLDTVDTLLAVAPAMPVVALTGSDQMELAVTAVEHGVQDYLIKDTVAPDHLGRAIRYAIERKRRENERRRTYEALALLRKLTLAVGEAPDAETALTLFVREVCRFTGWTAGEAWIPSLEGPWLERGTSFSEDGEALARFHAESEGFTFRQGEGMPGRAWLTKEPVWHADIQDSAESVRANLAREAGLHAAAVIPVIADDEVVAVLAFFQREPPETDDQLVPFVMTIAAQVGTVLRQRRAEQLLSEATHLLASSLDFEETLGQIARLTVPRLADMCVIDVLEDDGTVRIVKVAAADPRKEALITEKLERFPHDRSPAQHPGSQVLRTGESVLIATVSEEVLRGAAQSEEHLELLRAVEPRSAIVAPLRIKDRTFGAISLTTSESGRRLGQRDLAVATDLAGRAALAIENARLYERARAALRARDTVLGFVAHDLRNPLTAIAMQTDMMVDQASGERRAAHGEIIQHSVTWMDGLIQDLLEANQLEAGRLKMRPEPVTVRPLLHEAVGMIEGQAERAGLTLTVSPDELLPRVLADRQRTLQVLSNLLGNAVKFTPEGGAITLRATGGEKEVLISVADTGRGIPPEQMRHLFDQFWRGGEGRRGSAGLGLAISRGLVEAQGGRITAESQVGQGSTFSFALPAVHEAEPELSSTSASRRHAE